ncbi:hypothetical protein RN001_016261 [Aquatica leii]|uniref:Peroxidase n=1 Tax=Aquatica leii TaxID=1421715 RepID=A0AAN7PP01_9COLE|nr:hypothetical protein RN001_016261 [Aquatica leii]
MSTENSETTRLLSGESQPRYLMQPTIVQQRYRRLKRFQCCLCTIFLSAVVALVVFAVSYSINNNAEINNLDPLNTRVNNTGILLTLSWPITDRKQEKTCINHENVWQEALKFGSEALFKRDKLEEKIPTLDVNTPSYRHQKTFLFSNRSRILSRHGFISENAQKYLLGKNNVSLSTCNETKKGNISICQEFEIYQSYDGACNNLNNPFLYGVAYTPFRRALPAVYADGLSEPRIGVDGKQLPLARTVSLLVHRPLYRNDTKFTVMLAVWGQFIDHDITATALSQTGLGKNIPCCTQNEHPDCYSILISKSDPFYYECNITCMQFVRSAAAPSDTIEPRQQLNQASSYIDGSVIYGSAIEIANTLRDFQDGKLKTYLSENNKTLLPLSTDPNDGCNREEQNKIGRYCFVTGDQRANENLHLTSMHLIWVRQHNYLASELKNINPNWNDDKIFEEVRKIIIAQMQHITYNEFIRVIVGPSLRKKLNLNPKKRGYFTGYDKNIDASIANNFAAASFRFGHTLIPAMFKLLDNNSINEEYIQMHKMLFNPYSLYDVKGLDRSLRGAINTSIEASDTYFNDELLFCYSRSTLLSCWGGGGGDSVTCVNLNNALPCILKAYKLKTETGQFFSEEDSDMTVETSNIVCFSKFVSFLSFINLVKSVNMERGSKPKNIYLHVDDIDLYSGAISEEPLEGGILGPTFTCLVTDQFVRLKRGDRMWYENPQKPHAFTLDQLKEIRLTTLAKIICDNSDSVDQVQLYVMERIHESNKYTPCIEIPRPDLTKWKDGDLTRNHI